MILNGAVLLVIVALLVFAAIKVYNHYHPKEPLRPIPPSSGPVDDIGDKPYDNGIRK